MILVLGLLPFFGLLISALILGNAGRTLKEKITIFFLTPRDVEKDSANLLIFLRSAFWISLLLSAWMIAKISSFDSVIMNHV